MMTKLSLSIFIVLLNISVIFAQEATKDFKINLPEYHVPNSLYGSIGLIDSRVDPSQMGIVQLGAFNRKARVICEVPFEIQLQNAMTALTDSSAGDGQLVLQLRKLSFAEIIKATSEKGYCCLRANLYSKKNEYYYKLASIDTLVQIGAMDVTKALLRDGSHLITEFIANELWHEAVDEDSYSFDNLLKIDSIEKRGNIIYNTEKFTDGLYSDYHSFCMQSPDKLAQVKTSKDGNIKGVKVLSPENKLEKVKPRDVYALVYNGQPYVATAFGFYPMVKSDDEFYFTGKTKVSANSADAMAAGILFGVIGVLVASSTNATYVMQIDHYNGSFIPIRQVVSYEQ